MTEPAGHNVTEPVLVLIGPTAIGKTAASLELARTFGCEIISVDSMQVYRLMDIGTAKATPEEQREIPHHLLDLVFPDEDYNAARFAADAMQKIAEIHRRGAIPLLTGGTGLYLRALKEGLVQRLPAHPEIRRQLYQQAEAEGLQKLHELLMLYDRFSATKIHQNDSVRLIRALEIFLSTGTPLSEHARKQARASKPATFARMLSIGLRCDRQELYDRINQRTDLMLAGGLEEEVRRLLAAGYSPELKSMQSIGYRHMIRSIAGDWTAEQTRELLARDTRRYAKRQFTWFNADSSIIWFDRTDLPAVSAAVRQWLNNPPISLS